MSIYINDNTRNGANLKLKQFSTQIQTQWNEIFSEAAFLCSCTCIFTRYLSSSQASMKIDKNLVKINEQKIGMLLQKGFYPIAM